MSNSGPSGRGVDSPSHMPPRHPGRRHAGGERLDQAGLADPGLTADEHEPAVPGEGLPCVFGERRERGAAFQERHAAIVRHRAGPGPHQISRFVSAVRVRRTPSCRLSQVMN
ncbi:hypothetical protein GCM10020218_025040 [Dactylosporangium vinaceum]